MPKEEEIADLGSKSPNSQLIHINKLEKIIETIKNEKKELEIKVQELESVIKKMSNGGLLSYSKDLERKIRNLEAEKQLIESEKIRLDREVQSIKTELDRMRQPPLLTACVVKKLKDGRIIVRSSTGPEFIVKYTKNISPDDLKPGVHIALNQRTFSIVEIIEESEGPPPYNALRAWQGFEFEVKIIEVEDWPGITADLEKHFYIRIKSIEDLIEIAKYYRIPMIFKKIEEYIAIYYDTPLFWYKP